MSGKPRVVIDARMVGPVPHGFGRYVSQLALSLAEVEEHHSLSYEPVFLVNMKTPPDAIPYETVQVGASFLNPLELLEIPIVIRRLGALAFHSPTFSSLLPGKRSCPTIVTIHDLNHLKFGGTIHRHYYEKILKPFALASSAVLTVSDFSRDEIATWSGLPREKIEVVSNAIDPKFLYPLPDEDVDPVLRHFGLERGRYFLCLSNAKPHKNVACLLEAHAASNSPWPMVVSLSGEKTQSGDRVRRIGPVSDSAGHALLAAAGAVAFPSLYEGFGLPPVEAAIAGIPVLASDIPPHREGLQELQPGEATFIAPADVDGWTAALARAALGQLAKPSMDSRTRTLARFSRDRMGASMDRIYRRVLGLST